MRFDRSWLPGIAAVLGLILLERQLFGLPWAFRALLATAGSMWFLWTAWNIWRNPVGRGEFANRGPRVQYWRGQRIETPPASRARRVSSLPATQLIMAIFYAVTGAGILAIVVTGLMRRFG